MAACFMPLPGCGVQGEPLPPLLNVPLQAELHAVQRADRALLSWTLPALTTEGQAVRPEKLGPVEVYRAVLPGLRAEVSRQEFEAAARRVAELPAGQVDHSEPLPPGAAGSTLAYAVRLMNQRGDSAGFSNIVAVPALAAPPAVANLKAAATERAVELVWPASPGAAVYHLYKAEGESPLSPLSPMSPMIRAAEATEPRFSDASFQFGRDYRYMVRAVAAQGAFRAESGDSPAVSVRPEDVFPPAVPANVAAVVGGPVVELSWDPNSEADLAGYNLYRSEGGAEPRRLNNTPLVSPAFRDETAKPGAGYSYAVTALDRKGNESRRSEAVPVRVE